MTDTFQDKRAIARDLLARWDAQQTAYIKHRALRFETIAKTIAEICPARPRILDLACGPGSLTEAVLAANPDAHIVGVDKDPVLLAIARDAFAGRMKTSNLSMWIWTNRTGIRRWAVRSMPS